HLLPRARADVQDEGERAGPPLQIPAVAHRRGVLDVPHALPAHLRPGHLHAAAVADDALELHLLVAAAVALPVLDRTKDPLAEETIALRLEGAVVDRLGLLHLAVGPVAHVQRRRNADPDLIETADVSHLSLRSSSQRSAISDQPRREGHVLS